MFYIRKSANKKQKMDIANAQHTLKQYFGYDNFRPMQAEIIEAIYQKKDTLVLMPTGGGKSMCFQIPALTIEGTVLVVSPLISLMQDQVVGLQANGIKAQFLNSSQDSAEQRQVENDFYNGQLELLYVSPEKLCSESFLPLLQNGPVSLFAIDEAHCVSAWGHDFRPEYTKLSFLKRQFPHIPIIALTATADRLTREDIVKQLNFKRPSIFIASFDRPNLNLEVRPGQKRKQQIIQFIRKHPDQSGIVYCLSRKSTERLAADLNAAGFNARSYHAGMTSSDRAKVQNDFIKDDIPIICATIAFGMGIDKSNVRWVIHYNLPKNLENYYQEIGRAGRDGAPADTLLFYSFQDVKILTEILRNNDSKNVEVQLSKLDRMKEYAESVACRRRILLNYFNEDHNKNCGNCDICRNPPLAFDGSLIAQKALSAIFRLRERVGLNLLIDVLRGSARRDIMERGYDKIKTYGAGRDISTAVWLNYLSQLVNLGYIEIAYAQHGVLKLTPASKRVLFEKEAVELVRFNTIKERREKEKKQVNTKTKREGVRDQLFEHLRQLRRKLAQEKGVPPYIIFSDKTLEEMAATKPITEADMSNISGVGEQKLRMYSRVFIDAIVAFTPINTITAPVAALNESQLTSLELLRNGYSLEEIASQRTMAISTISSHLYKCYRGGEDFDISPFVNQSTIDQIAKRLPSLEKPIKAKPLFDFFEQRVSYEQIRFALAYLEKERNIVLEI